jgi:hypothetical protein
VGATTGAVSLPPTFSLTWLTNAEESSAGTVITYSGLSFGAADPNRVVIVGIGARISTASNFVSSVTIGGIGATAVASTYATAGAANSQSVLYQAAVPSGTSGNVVVTYSVATVRTAITLYRLITGTPAATSGGSNFGSGVTILGVALTIPTGGKAAAFSYEAATANAITWTNATLDFSAVNGGTSQYSSATTTTTGSVTVLSNYGAASVATVSAAAWGS